MRALFATLIYVFAETAGSSGGWWGSFREFWDHYLNYPGFELWKFINLAIFVFILYYFAQKLKLTDAFKARREEIRADIIRAEQEKQAALSELAAVEAKLVGVDAEKKRILSAAREEIDHEKQRLASQAELETVKLKAQAEGEVVRLGQVAKLQLRRFAVYESLRMAEEKLRTKVDKNTDAVLIRAGIDAIGGLN